MDPDQARPTTMLAKSYDHYMFILAYCSPVLLLRGLLRMLMLRKCLLRLSSLDGGKQRGSHTKGMKITERGEKTNRSSGYLYHSEGRAGWGLLYGPQSGCVITASF